MLQQISVDYVAHRNMQQYTQGIKLKVMHGLYAYRTCLCRVNVTAFISNHSPENVCGGVIQVQSILGYKRSKNETKELPFLTFQLNHVTRKTSTSQIPEDYYVHVSMCWH